jgi:hypothetical protein
MAVLDKELAKQVTSKKQAAFHWMIVLQGAISFHRS